MHRLLTVFLLMIAFHPAAQETNHEAAVKEAKGKVFIGTGKPPGKERPAQKDAKLAATDYLRTGKESHAEVEFTSGALTRLGPLSLFRFSSNKNEYTIERGEGLFVFPKGKGGATISTPSFSAGILGTTVYLRADRNNIEYLCLEGRCSIGPHLLSAGEKLSIRGSQTAYSAPKTKFDVGRFLRENPLINGFSTPLPSRSLIEQESAEQR